MKKLSLLVLLLLSITYSMAQQFTVKGKVLDKDTAEPIIGVTVVETGTSNAVGTNVDGEFEMRVASESSTLDFHYAGYLTTTLNVEVKMEVFLEPDVATLEEIVVVGYGTMRKSDLTGAVGRVGADDLLQLSTVDAAQALQGKVAGVSVQVNSGEPGSGTTIRIRGVGSLSNSDPLYVVDGVPVSDISHIAPNDILSIEVLKDASATAIYGSRGANGVILVQTKGGEYDQKTKVTVNVYSSISNVVDEIDMCNASEYALLKRESYANSGTTMSDTWDAILSYVEDTGAEGTNWQDEIFRTAYTQNYNVGISGGSAKNKYSLGITYSDEQGVLKETEMQKFMANLSNQYRLNDHFDMGIDVYYTNYEKQGNNSDYYSGPLVAALRADPISAAWDDYTNDYGEVYFAYGTNPARAVSENQYNTYTGNRLVSSAFLNIKDIGVKGLSFKAQFGATIANTLNKEYSPVYYVTPDQQRQESSLYEYHANNFNWTTSEYLNYNGTFGKHSINAMVGFEASMYTSNYVSMTAMNVPEDENLQYISASSSATSVTAAGLKSQSSLASYFGRANYSYDNRYMLTATVRADGSSKFVDHWGYFPSFSAGWNISQEDFMDNVSSKVSQLKLRAGWGQVGNQNAAGNYDYVALMSNGYYYVFGDNVVDGAIQEDIANAELSWETTEQTNIGLDFGFFNNSLTASVDYFIRDTKDMILSTPIPMYAGYWKPTTNAGSVRNSGVEFIANYSKSFNNGFSFDVGFNISSIKNEVLSIGGGDPIEGGNVSNVGNTTRTEVGYEIAYFYGLQTDGIFNTQEELDAYVDADGNAIQPNASLGDVKFVDLNGDGVIDETTDRTYLGSAIPDFYYGFNFGFGYKGIDFRVDINGSYGNEIVNGMYQTLYSSSMREWNVAAAMLDRWTPDNTDTDTPRVTSSDPNGNDKFSDLYVEDGSYLRIRNMQIGYSFPQSMINKIGLGQLRVYVSADNLCTITGYSGFDPEVAGSNDLSAGVDIANYPIPRTFSLGINVQF